jgi:hypothetical protein
MSLAAGHAGEAGRPGHDGCLTLTTDYGYGAGFVGTLHAVAFRIAPTLKVIDLDHSVPPQDVRLGALRLERFMRFAPPGVHVGVVDPGVGSSRRAVAIAAGAHVFVGPDNGLLPWAAEAAGGAFVRAVLLDRPQFWLDSPSRTFDGRDVFVPVAAQLASGRHLDEVGSEIDPAGLVRLVRPAALVDDGSATLELLQVDGFGNVQLSGDETTVAALGLHHGDPVRLDVAGRAPLEATYVETFAAVARGSTVVLIDSDGCLAVSVNCGRADTLLGDPAGATIRLRPG